MISGIGDLRGSQDDVDQFSSTDPQVGDGMRQWTYQACTEFGYWFAEGATPGSQLDLPSTWLCTQLFRDAPHFDSARYNQEYEAPFIAEAQHAPSNILFTYGERDIWTTIGLWGQKNLNPGIHLRFIQGGSHHQELNASSPFDGHDVIRARAEFLKLAQKWLTP